MRVYPKMSKEIASKYDDNRDKQSSAAYPNPCPQISDIISANICIYKKLNLEDVFLLCQVS